MNNGPEKTFKPSKYELQGTLKIMSRNIHDTNDSILGSKTSRKCFNDAITPSDIFCLQETKNNLKVPGYKCYNSERPDSRSGGICLGVRHELLPFVNHVNTNKMSPDIQAVVLSSKLTNLPKDTLLVNIYDSPDNSSYKLKLMAEGRYEETLETLDNILQSHGQNRFLMMCGDFNARTGTENSSPGTEDQVLDELKNGTFSTMSHPNSE